MLSLATGSDIVTGEWWYLTPRSMTQTLVGGIILSQQVWYRQLWVISLPATTIDILSHHVWYRQPWVVSSTATTRDINRHRVWHGQWWVMTSTTIRLKDGQFYAWIIEGVVNWRKFDWWSTLYYLLSGETRYNGSSQLRIAQGTTVAINA